MWKDKIKEGYLYQIGSGSFTAITGSSGAIEYGKCLEKEGISSDLIEESISITNDDGLYSNTIFVPLREITWTKHG